MLRYAFRQIRLRGAGLFYLPLPKMHHGQLRFLAEHLRSRGFSVSSENFVRGRRGGQTVTISQAGLAWSALDLTDVLAPAIPRLLLQNREKASANPYFSGEKRSVRLLPRLEAGRLWTQLREEGEAGLTDDEGFVIKHLLRGVGGDVRCVTDLPEGGSNPFRVGKKQFYVATLPVEEFLSRLAVMSAVSHRRAYLPRNGVLHLDREIPRSNLSLPWGELGEWCFVDGQT